MKRNVIDATLEFPRLKFEELNDLRLVELTDRLYVSSEVPFPF